MQRARLVNALDRDRVRETFRDTPAPAPHVRRLLDRVDGARPVRPVSVPPDLVTMNSIVRVIDTATGESDTYALRYGATRPCEAHEATMVTIHDLLGSELLARWVGESFEFEGRRGPVRLRVAGMDYQPERSGHLRL